MRRTVPMAQDSRLARAGASSWEHPVHCPGSICRLILSLESRWSEYEHGHGRPLFAIAAAVHAGNRPALPGIDAHEYPVAHVGIDQRRRNVGDFHGCRGSVAVTSSAGGAELMYAEARTMTPPSSCIRPGRSPSVTAESSTPNTGNM